jgi:putative transcriptional regulator
MHKLDISNLTGKCLISMPDNNNEFARAVIYICSHGNDGAMGFVINKRMKDISFSELALELPINFSNCSTPISLYNGGPMEKGKGFILHSDEYQLADSINTGGGIMVSSSFNVLQDIAAGHGPKQRIIALGYAGWAPSQLETEITNNLWMVVDATPELVLGVDDETKWNKAISALGINDTNFTSCIGHS